MAKFIRIDMASKAVKIEECPEKYAGLAGRGLTSNFVADEVKPTCHPLGKYNKLIFAPGYLTGTSAANSGRLSCGAKSPLTGGIKESNTGGTFGQKMSKMDIKALVFEGIPEDDKYYVVKVTMNEVTIDEAPAETIGMGNYEAIKVLQAKYGPKVGVAIIGTAGEMRLTAANISFADPQCNIRSAGRGGLGAVMGSKKIKAVVIDETGAPGVTISNPEAFKSASKRFTNALTTHPVTGQGLPKYGTNVLVNILNEAGGLPTKNFRCGRNDWANNIGGETMAATIEARGGKTTHGCHAGCIIRCSQHYNDKEGKYLTSGFEYETVWALGANAMINDLDVIAYADREFDDVGVDSIETAVAVGVAMEGGAIPWGDGKAALDLIMEIRKGTPLGRILGSGAGAVGQMYGLTRVPVVKNQAIPAYDPRAVKGVGLTYATTPMGADHTAGYAVATNILKVGGFVDPLGKEGQVELSRNLQIATAAVDSTGMCLFIAFAILDIADGFNALVEMINARYNLSLTGDDVVALGKSILKAERGFNQRAGFTNADDRLPEFFEEECAPHNVTWNFTDEEIDEVFNF
ncbi:Aldehyde ferredoxin oxidoreductase [Solidesulfovibrio carbinoliphilus subsp. oakridgensis]|uniref:Aldehyde ferredoxin oxidoreductase n=1 Tax=Solidesulfovibrio carbinoliphilus subsp. oakridgensis TaxID=694327 RepID=G7Q8N9_9BACT|nr:aldehyde ferredoxin oxidoreductase C-terminal domain-containing protein [Solidesulfovibrio carbinoliphilus]EHJ49126.1 Aldehyde ferredoxin oxidoreductase [Solidesulfovibrio carbinoliphilus subsp. oakridgensis]